MQLIAATDAEWGIGKDGQLLFHIPEDLRRFKALTMGHTVVMGRNTLYTMPGCAPLTGRENIILSRNMSLSVPGAAMARSLEELFSLLSRLDPDDVFIIGGANVYAQLLPWCDKARITRVYQVFPQDAAFPDLDKLENWHITNIEPEQSHGDLRYQFIDYENDCPLPLP